MLNDLHNELFQSQLKYKGINLLALSQVYIADYYRGNFSEFSWVKQAKIFSIDNVIKMISCKFYPSYLKNTNFKYGIINDVDNAPLKELVKLLLTSLPKDKTIEIFANPKVKSQNNQIHSQNIFIHSSFLIFFTSLFDFISLFISKLKNNEEIKFIHKKYDVKKSHLYLNILDSIFLINVLEKYLSNSKIEKLVLNTDVHKLSRIMTLLARNSGIPSFVLQHGATIGKFGYLPILATKIFLWGQESYQWLKNNKQAENKLVITGSPRMDSYRYDFINKKENFSNIKKILIVMAPIGYKESKQFLEMILKSILMNSSIQDIELTIKLHPSSNDYKDLPETVFGLTNLDFRIFKNEPLSELIKETDCVISTKSTAGMEALIFNKPLIQIKFDHKFFMPYEKYDCSFNANNYHEINALLINPERLNSKRENYFQFISDYYFKLDGQSMKRICNYLENYHE